MLMFSSKCSYFLAEVRSKVINESDDVEKRCGRLEERSIVDHLQECC